MKLAHSFRLFVFTVLALVVATPTSQAEIIDLDLTGLDPAITTPQVIAAFQGAEAFWDNRILGYSNTIPGDIRPNLTGRLLITVQQDDFGDTGIIATAGVAGGVTSVLGGRDRAVAQTSQINFDPNTVAGFTQDELQDVLIHEMAHALGFGTLWEANNLIQPIPPRGGILQYRGINARRTFAEEAGFNVPQVGFVPLEQGGGPGTALSHWDNDNFFFNSIAQDNRIELMTGFFIPNTDRFISETTFATLVDLGYVVSGFNEDELIDFSNPPRNIFPGRSINNDGFFGGFGFGFNATTGNPFRASSPAAALTFGGDAASVPEPSALMLLLAGVSAMSMRRQRNAG